MTTLRFSISLRETSLIADAREYFREYITYTPNAAFGEQQQGWKYIVWLTVPKESGIAGLAKAACPEDLRPFLTWLGD